jgi:hypothetical protein
MKYMTQLPTDDGDMADEHKALDITPEGIAHTLLSR